MNPNTNNGPVKSLYEKYKTSRQAFLDRARDCATYTIPTLMPPEGANEHTKYPTPYQGIGARGVNNLSAKLLLALLPPNSPFFKYNIEISEIKAQLEQDPKLKTEIEYALALIEQRIQNSIEGSNIRPSMFEALKHLVNSGNVLIYVDPTNSMKVYNLNKYVVKRTPAGDVIDIITKESTYFENLPEPVRLLVKMNEKALGAAETESAKQEKRPVDIYTRIQRVGDQWKASQEINGLPIPQAVGTYPLGKCPWLALRFIKVDGEDYGRGYVEEYIGDLISAEELTKAIVQGSVAMAKVLFLVKPNSTTKKKDLEDAANCDIVSGDVNDVGALQVEKTADFRVALETLNQIIERLSFAFLLNAAVQREGERVTAEEIRYMAGELEDALGGIYSILTQELQLPLVKIITNNLEKMKKLPAMPEGLVAPTIVTGLEALGRGHEQQKLDAFIGHLQPLGMEVLAQYMNIDDYIKRCATNMGIDTTGLVKTKEEIQAERDAAAQAQQQAMMMQNVVKPAISAGPQAAKAMMDAQNQTQVQ